MSLSSSAMDISSSSAGVKRPRPILRRQRRIPYGKGLTRKQALQVQRLMQKNIELKYIAFNSGVTTAVSQTMNISSVPWQVPQGTTDSTRIGDELTWISIKLRFEILNSSGALSDAFNNVRLVIFQWKPNSTPVATDVFIPGPSGVPDIWSTYGHDRRNEFCIVYDESFKTVGNQLAATNPATSDLTTGVQDRSISLKYAQKKCHFSAAGVTASNLFFIALVSDSSVAPHPTITYQVKTFYRDG